MRWFRQSNDQPEAPKDDGALPTPHEREGFSLAYQPIFDLYSPTLAGVEVLVRWNRGDDGRLPASAFVREYDEASRLSELGTWVFNHATSAVQGWRERGLRPPRCFINVSEAEVSSPSFAGLVEEALNLSGLDGDFLGVELPPHMLEPGQAWAEHATRLTPLGVRASAEEFGTELEWLRNAPYLGVTMVKIDVARATHETYAASSLSAVDAAHHADLRICGTRVEAPAHIEMLTTLRCDMAQGFSFAGPLSANEFEDLLVEAQDWK